MKVRYIGSFNFAGACPGKIVDVEEHPTDKDTYVFNGQKAIKHLFEPVIVLKVKCIDTVGLMGKLLHGEIYEAVARYDNDIVYDIGGDAYEASRFVRVNTSSHTIACAQSASVDVEEDRLRAILTRPADGSCVKCGAPCPCSYHPGIR